MKCPVCEWSWEMEHGDDRPYLCHKCGYDSNIDGFDKKALHQWEEENDYPFDEYMEEGYYVRTFSEGVDVNELVWHRDKEDRVVESVGDTDWMIQLDNELPKPLTESIYIPKETYHRVIKGNGDLNVKIKKL